jgi:hypothetical protein
MTELVERITTIFLASRQTNKVYAREDPANQDSGRARKESRGDRRVDRRDRWFAASHLLKILRKLVFEAQVRGMRFGELVGTLITAAMERDLLRRASYMNMAAFNREQDSINYLIMKFSCHGSCLPVSSSTAQTA